MFAAMPYMPDDCLTLNFKNMATKTIQKKFSCKNEELPVIGGYVLTSIKRDSDVFAAFSPLYGEEGIKLFEYKVFQADELVSPKSGTNELKNITGVLYSEMDSMVEKVRRIEGYVMMSKGVIPISAKDFGIPTLKQRAKVRDAEGTLDNLKFVNANIAKYKDILTEKGMTDELSVALTKAVTTISYLNIRQYEASNERKMIIQNNINTLNALYDSISEICSIGKILFGDNKEKMKEYTFSKLRKRVHIASKPENSDGAGENNMQQPAV